MKKLNTISCEEIMTQPLKPIEFVVDNLITQGLFILAGAPKIGKSWLALDICLSIAKGETVLNANTKQGTALYLCLEDSKIRIQNRLYEMTDEPTEHLHFALIADTIGSGLEEQIVNFITEHQDTKVIFIDTLQKIRSDSPESTYATDYKELSVLKSIADKHPVAIVLVHHLRKTKDSDPFNMISGTTGLSGCVDGSFVLSESKRGSRNATLYCVGRDIENREIELKFDNEKHRWVSDEIPFEKENKSKIFIEKIFDFISERKKFIGTATELANLIAPMFETEIFPNRLDNLFAKMYEDRAKETITERNFAMLSAKYQDEQTQLESKKQELQAKLNKSAQDTDGAEKWLSLVRKYTDLTELTVPLLNELIDKIVVHQAENDENGSRTQEIEIFYRFVGKID